MEDSSAFLASLVASGDRSALHAVFDRYVARLIALVRPRISKQLGQRIDPEDVAQSTFRSFFRRAGLGELKLGRGAPLWRLLSAIALNKLHKQAEHHLAAKRSIQRESAAPAMAGDDWLAQSIASREPGPADAAALADELEALLAKLDPLARHVVELRLADYSHEEIAVAVQRSDRTVRRILADVQTRWRRRNAS